MRETMRCRRLGAALGLWAAWSPLLLGCSDNAAPARDEGLLGDRRDTAVRPAADAPEARAAVDAIRARFVMASAERRSVPATAGDVLGPPVADRVERDGGWLRPHIAKAVRGTGRVATVALPVRASGPFQLIDKGTGMTVEVSLRGATEAPAEVSRGLVVYRKGHISGAVIVHRPTAEGTEDHLFFERAPEQEQVEYELVLGEQVAGVRLVADTLELLDAAGAPRLRMAPPYVLDAGGERHAASVVVSGCGYDADPRAPWGRAVVMPEARQCTVRVGWQGRAVRYPILLDPLWSTTGSMSAGRAYHTASVLWNGHVLVAGGGDLFGFFLGTELYDPATGTWSATGSMAEARFGHTASLLSNGKVLVAGGYDSGILTGAELYDPATGMWSAAGPMVTPRFEHTAGVLANGNVLVAGGWTGVAYVVGAELYDPVTDSWSGTGNLTEWRRYHTLSVLSIGKVLVAGGVLGMSLASVELYDPTTGTFSATGSMLQGHSGHTASVLSSGKVLVVGGRDGLFVAGQELYDPVVAGGECCNGHGLPLESNAAPRGEIATRPRPATARASTARRMRSRLPGPNAVRLRAIAMSPRAVMQ